MQLEFKVIPDWKYGVPTKKGLYWFDPGLTKTSGPPGILQIFSSDNPIYHDRYGSMPLNMVYNESICYNAKFIKIKKTNTWQDKSILSKHSMGWVRKRIKGKYVFGFFYAPSIFGSSITIDILWLNGDVASDHGTYVTDNMKFSLVDYPEK